uniref:Uncharacterized protein n=1 Tax=Acanthochromis polyacanthus TaxID=80966 RepID=A0A3Q1GVZ6_9TELE
MRLLWLHLGTHGSRFSNFSCLLVSSWSFQHLPAGICTGCTGRRHCSKVAVL